MNTKSAILDTALELFNQQGTAAISTNHIAAALGISPGNLYYHYRNKQEIIHALFERLFAVWDEAFDLPPGREPSLDDLQTLVRTNFEVLWTYRFIYRELAALLREDDNLQQRFLEVRQRGFEGFRELFAQFSKAGVIPPVDSPAALDEITELCWLISEFWLPYIEVGGREVNAANLETAVRLTLRVIGADSSS